MRHILSKIIFLIVLFITRAQTNLAGNYFECGYFYHCNNASFININLTKTIIHLAARKYLMALADQDGAKC